MIVAIVPAAGKSQRMGQPKLLLPLGPRRVVEHVLAALLRSKVDQTIIVLPPGADELADRIRNYPVHCLLLNEETSDMRATVVQALRFAAKLPKGPPQAFVLAPADQPTLSTTVVDTLIDRFRAPNNPHSILIATFGGRRGHPVLMRWLHADAIADLPAGRGINHLIASLGDAVGLCEMDDPGLLEDLDTPADYDRLQQRAWR